MCEIQSVGANDTSLLIAIRLDARLDGSPRSVYPVVRGLCLIIDRLEVVVHDVTAGVRECPRNITIESNHHTRHAGEANSGDVELTGNDDVHLIPYRRQCEIEMRIPGE